MTVFVGYSSRSAQTKLSAAALGIYDDTFQPMNYLRSAQVIVLGISRDLALGETNEDTILDQLQSALDALDVAHERAMSANGEAQTRRLQVEIADLQALIRAPGGPIDRRGFQEIEQAFDLTVAVYAADGFRRRLTAEALVHDTQVETYLLMGISLVIASIITLLLGRAIVPSIRQAASVASAIAAGKLDNRIDVRGSRETGLLLGALATMQASIADKISRIEHLMAQQASNHDVEIASQNARFETALDHMTIGLRMFDASDELVVQNRKFSDMFDESSGSDWEGQLRAVTLWSETPRAPSYRLLEDGRTIEVSEATMLDGGRVVTYEDVTERRRAEERLWQMARHDALTGLPNRVYLREHLQEKVLADGQGKTLSVLCLDLDRFKAVNDTLGHSVGDELLREAADRLRASAGDQTFVARLGGDEFAVIQVAETADARNTDLANGLIAALAAPFHLCGSQISISTSIGIAEAAGGTHTPDDLLKRADLALYSAKAAGRGTYRVFEHDMDARVQARLKMELDLRAAVTEDQFILYYQPLVNAASGEIVSYEALLRWDHPERGLVSPSEFIPVAEETGLISGFGLWVLERACRDAAAWPSHIKVAVNLSPLQFQYRDLLGDVAEALRKSGLPPTRLDLEITESVMLQDSADTLSTLHSLRKLGIGISLDDFGTGYSALSYLRMFPFDKIKIDRAFVKDVVGSQDGIAIVEAVIRLGQSLRMKIVAEGVETLDQYDLLRRAGCQELQGFLFGRPAPKPDIGVPVAPMRSAA